MAHILVVEDDPDFVEVTRMVLESNGYEVNSASDGKEALELMRQSKPDLVLLDMMMTDVLDGLGVTQKMHDDPELEGIPIIVVSAMLGGPFAGQFPTDEHLHVSDWLNKPVEPKVLLEKIEHYLEKP
jgi:CheY-like chemotaxis protein